MSSLGERLGDLRRRRGLTQEQLAEDSEISVSAVRKIERGERDGGRIATMHALARALGVPTAELFGPPGDTPAPITGERGELDLMGIRRVLTPSPGSGEAIGGEVQTVDELSHTFRVVASAYRANDLSAVTLAMPQLITDAEALKEAADTDDGTRAADGVLGNVYHLCGRLLTQVRDYDLAYFVIRRALEVTDDPLGTTGGAVSAMCWLFLRQGRLDEVEQMATHAADAVEPRMSTASLRELTTWSSHLLWAAAGAVRNNQPDRVVELMRLAHAAAAQTRGMDDRARGGGRESPDWTFFHPTLTHTKVARQEVQNAVIVGDYRAALARHEHTPMTGRPTSTSRNRYLLDVASAHVGVRDYTEATEILRGIRAAVPQWLQHQRLARDLMGTVLARRTRPLTTDMRALADYLAVS